VIYNLVVIDLYCPHIASILGIETLSEKLELFVWLHCGRLLAFALLRTQPPLRHKCQAPVGDAQQMHNRAQRTASGLLLAWLGQMVGTCHPEADIFVGNGTMNAAFGQKMRVPRWKTLLP
jgi:hypothetical protein